MPTVVATDNFNRADGPIGSNWTNAISGEGFNVSSNAATPVNDGVNAVVFWNANSFENDQYSKCILVADNVGFKGPGARFSVDNGYIVNASHAGTIRIQKVVGGALTELQNTGDTPVAGDELKIEVTGQSPNIEIKAYKNGSQVGTTVTGQSDHNSGAAGIYVHDPGGLSTRVDDFEGGNLADVTAKPFISVVGAKRFN